MYVAVKGGEEAIENSQRLLEQKRRGDPAVDELSIEQIKEQMSLAVDRVMTEGSLYNRDLAALAIKQAQGDLVEAIFLLRAYRTTLPRLGVSEPINTNSMRIQRRISSTFKDIPGGQVLGATYDYTHRLLDFSLMAEGDEPVSADELKQMESAADTPRMPRVVDLLNAEGLIETESDEAGTGNIPDLTREPLTLPADRQLRLQALARADEGFLLALGYSTQRGYGNNHPFAGEIRHGTLDIEITPPELGFSIVIGEIEITECEMINQFTGSKKKPPQFTRGYGIAFGHSERKAMSMALVDRALRCAEFGETVVSPAQDQEFVLSHTDNVEASGFVQHLKLPHYVDFQSELELVRRLRKERLNNKQSGIDEKCA